METLLAGMAGGMTGVLRAVADITASAADVDQAMAAFRDRVEAALRLPEATGHRLCPGLGEVTTWQTLLAGLVVESAAAVGGPSGSGDGLDVAVLGDLELGPVIATALASSAPDGVQARGQAALAAALHRLPLPGSVASLPAADRAPGLVRALAADEAVRAAIGVNLWDGVTWFDGDAFERVLWWIRAWDALDAVTGAAAPALEARLAAASALTGALSRAAETCGYHLDDLERAAGGV